MPESLPPTSAPSPPTSWPRRIRLQVSLRMLLLGMALIGTGLTIYRWPWVVETETVVGENDELIDPLSGTSRYLPRLLYRAKERTTYRRNWRAQPTKHGIEQTFRDDQLRMEMSYYEGVLHGPRLGYNKLGILVLEANYRGGRLHGLARIGDGDHWHCEGAFTNGQPDGPWREVLAHAEQFDCLPICHVSTHEFVMPSKPIVVHSQWQRGRRHGDWKWQTLAGETLITAKYANDNLLAWNGEPVVEQFWSWLKQDSSDDPKTLKLLKLANHSNWLATYDRDGRSLSIAIHSPELAVKKELLHIHTAGLDSEWLRSIGGPALDSALCELAAQRNYRFAYRYGGLWILNSTTSVAFVDHTGVAAISFASGSDQERDWNEEVGFLTCNECGEDCIRELLRETSIRGEVPISDNSNFRAMSPFGFNPKPLLIRRRRRDLVGLVLFLSDLQCELREGELVISDAKRRHTYQLQTPGNIELPH